MTNSKEPRGVKSTTTRPSGHPDPTHRMASAKVRYIFYLGVLALSVMIYYLVQVRYLTEELPKKNTPPTKAVPSAPQ